METVDRIMQCVFRVEASSFELQVLCARYGNRLELENHGVATNIGNLDGRPIVISLMFGTFDDQHVLFWHATSQLVDYKMIDDWFCCNTPHLRGPDKATDATNFHIYKHDILKQNS